MRRLPPLTAIEAFTEIARTGSVKSAASRRLKAGAERDNAAAADLTDPVRAISVKASIAVSGGRRRMRQAPLRADATNAIVATLFALAQQMLRCEKDHAFSGILS